MIQKLVFTLTLLFTATFYGQVNFEKGYFIDNDNNKTECLIRNKGWKDNPTNFEFKIAETDQIANKSIKDVSEFGIEDVVKYKRAKCKIDYSSNSLEKVSATKEPEWQKKTVFLKIIIEGEATLFDYVEGNLTRYFYQTPTRDIEQLVYKRYSTDFINYKANNEFHNQLWTNVACENMSIDKATRIDYNKKELSNYFIDYNKCKNGNYVDAEPKKSNWNVNIKAKIGAQSSKLSIENSNQKSSVDFGSKTSPKFGFEVEYVLPFKNNKWAMFFEGTHQGFKSEGIFSYKTQSAGTQISEKWKFEYANLDLTLGGRYYMFLNSKSKLYVNAGYAFVVLLKSELTREKDFLDSYPNESAEKGVVALGFGYNYNNKFGIELKGTSYDLLDNYIHWKSKYSTVSLLFSYTIFNNNKYHKK